MQSRPNTSGADPIETVVRRVAEGLGWPVREPYSCCSFHRIQVPEGSSFYEFKLEKLLAPDLIILAAYAEAAAHNRGFRLVRLEHPDRISMRHHSDLERTDPNPYDPADPVSKAQAVLRAVDEAIGGAS